MIFITLYSWFFWDFGAFSYCYAAEILSKLATCNSLEIYLDPFLMNNQNPFLPFAFTPKIRINVHVDQKIFFQQRIALMFGAAVLREVLESPLPVIIPVINYEVSFDMHIFILL